MKLYDLDEIKTITDQGKFITHEWPLLDEKYSDRWEKAKEAIEVLTDPMLMINNHKKQDGRDETECRIKVRKNHARNYEESYESDTWSWLTDIYHHTEGDDSCIAIRKKLYIIGGTPKMIRQYKIDIPVLNYWIEFWKDMEPIVEHYGRIAFPDVNRFIHRLCIIEYSYPTATPENYVEQRKFNTVSFGDEHCDEQLAGWHIGENYMEYQAQNKQTGEYEYIPNLDKTNTIYMFGEFAEKYGFDPTYHRMIHNPDPTVGTRYSLICNTLMDPKWQ